MKNQSTTLLLIFLFSGLSVSAQTNVTTPAIESLPTKVQTFGKPANKATKENLLDFEAEVIEGEKKRPELFLDIKAGDGNVGSGLYMRPHFDDFFAVDKKRRPRFIKSK